MREKFLDVYFPLLPLDLQEKIKNLAIERCKAVMANRIRVAYKIRLRSMRKHGYIAFYYAPSIQSIFFGDLRGLRRVWGISI